jgi:hypothetical protein
LEGSSIWTISTRGIGAAFSCSISERVCTGKAISNGAFLDATGEFQREFVPGELSKMELWNVQLHLYSTIDLHDLDARHCCRVLLFGFGVWSLGLSLGFGV